ncbi:MAG TPA: hypothetical protein VGN79_07970 [Devosia sp.]|jgi:hypothetical protein|nr:hypothetical protein [Devosia sp.]
MVKIRHEPVTVQLGSSLEQGVIVFSGIELLALLVFLEPADYVNDPDIAGKWSVEFGFGRLAVGSRTVLFDSLEAGLAWITELYSVRSS